MPQYASGARRYSSAFSYYGSKSKLAGRYPPPLSKRSRIIEPFAGSAAYSLRHGELREVWINDLDPVTFAIWRFLTHRDALWWVRNYIPARVRSGDNVETLFLNAHVDSPGPYPAPEGLLALMKAEAHMGTCGTAANYTKITSLSATCWNRRLRRRLEWVIPRVAHWKVTNLDYRSLPLGDENGTWFVDPPYCNAAGRHYRTNAINYDELAAWCRRLRGQVIVCENEGATWLPFQVLTEKRVGFNTVHRKTSVREAVWVRPPLPEASCPSPEVGES